jgi:hypothetical protein
MVGHAKGTAAGVWRERLDRFEVSGLSVKEFCAAEAVSDASFYQWRKKLAGARRKRGRPVASVFQAVRVTPAVAVWSIKLPGGARIEAPADHLKLARALVKEVVRASRTDNAGGA